MDLFVLIAFCTVSLRKYFAAADLAQSIFNLRQFLWAFTLFVAIPVGILWPG
jgi:hypothetical protein